MNVKEWWEYNLADINLEQLSNVALFRQYGEWEVIDSEIEKVLIKELYPSDGSDYYWYVNFYLLKSKASKGKPKYKVIVHHDSGLEATDFSTFSEAEEAFDRAVHDMQPHISKKIARERFIKKAKNNEKQPRKLKRASAEIEWPSKALEESMENSDQKELEKVIQESLIKSTQIDYERLDAEQERASYIDEMRIPLSLLILKNKEFLWVKYAITHEPGKPISADELDIENLMMKGGASYLPLRQACIKLEEQKQIMTEAKKAYNSDFILYKGSILCVRDVEVGQENPSWFKRLRLGLFSIKHRIKSSVVYLFTMLCKGK